MTFREAIDQRVGMLRLPMWNQGTHLEIYYTPDGGVGPWVTLIDVSQPEPRHILITRLLDDTSTQYEAWLASQEPTPAPSSREKAGRP